LGGTALDGSAVKNPPDRSQNQNQAATQGSDEFHDESFGWWLADPHAALF